MQRSFLVEILVLPFSSCYGTLQFMKTMRTIKIKITGSTKADKILPVWLSAINWLSGIVFKTKETNSNRLHKANYAP
jgi:hypothetical protein